MTDSAVRHFSEAQIAQYERDGVLLVKNGFDAFWIDKMREAVDDALAHPSTLVLEIADANAGRFSFDTWIWRNNAKWRHIIFNSPAAAMAAQFMRAQRVNLVFDYTAVKEPHTPKKTAWHQDAPGNPVDGLQSCSMWISLDTVTADSGALRYVRGSHLWGRSFEPMGSGDIDKTKFAGRTAAAVRPDGVEQMPDIDSRPDDYDIATIATEPGDFIIHNLMTVHSAGGNGTDRRRRAFGLRFAGETAVHAVRQTRLNIRPLEETGLKHGEPFPADAAHPFYPMVWPLPAKAAE